tara:strand:- start:819 stop:1370 length:552 start_codon:yes stop_codon:yes gene_type:complete
MRRKRDSSKRRRQRKRDLRDLLTTVTVTVQDAIYKILRQLIMGTFDYPIYDYDDDVGHQQIRQDISNMYFRMSATALETIGQHRLDMFTRAFTAVTDAKLKEQDALKISKTAVLYAERKIRIEVFSEAKASLLQVIPPELSVNACFYTEDQLATIEKKFSSLDHKESLIENRELVYFLRNSQM